jgi:hypothetical protein
VSGHGFSRAAESSNFTRALALEVVFALSRRGDETTVARSGKKELKADS